LNLTALWESSAYGFKGRGFRIGERVIHRAGQGTGRAPVFRIGTVLPSTKGQVEGGWVGRNGSVRVRFDGDDHATVIPCTGRTPRYSPLRRVGEGQP